MTQPQEDDFTYEGTKFRIKETGKVFEVRDDDIANDVTAHYEDGYVASLEKDWLRKQVAKGNIVVAEDE